MYFSFRVTHHCAIQRTDILSQQCTQRHKIDPQQSPSTRSLLLALIIQGAQQQWSSSGTPSEFVAQIYISMLH
jgi:hypothetical protein